LQNENCRSVTFDIPKEVDDALRARAKNEDRSKSAVIRQAIRADFASDPDVAALLDSMKSYKASA